MKTICIATVLLAATGCASAKLPSLRDPAYANHEFSKVAVFAVGMYLGDPLSVENQVCDKLAPAQCVSGAKLAAPARRYSPDDINRALTQANVDGVLVLMLGDDQVSSAFLSSIIAGSKSPSSSSSSAASLDRSIAVWTASSPPTTTQDASRLPIYNYQRAGHAAVGLFDRGSGKTAWGGELNVSGQGEESISDKVFVEAATNALAAQIRKNRLVRVPAVSQGGR